MDDWGKVKDEVYKFAVDQAITRFNDAMSTNEDISNKSQRLLIGYGAFVTAALGVSFKFRIPGDICIVGLLFHLYGIVLIVMLHRTKTLPFRGDNPTESFGPQLLDPKICRTPEEQIKYIYYHTLRRYQKKIDFTDAVNAERANLYDFALMYVFFLVIGTILFVLYSIFHPW